ncbi:MAG: SUMF1/EgtB/PvdO family nonheme iron enzyme [Candidatus Handelsmanbacteria bacterium]|nr:SUMF1/EgtB/PvdO family nonheme iron enzyme [Candidatus Handelsmanbacteria bacterium]
MRSLWVWRRRGCWVLLLLWSWACQTEVPTWGREVWGRDQGAQEVIPLGSVLSEIVLDPRRPYLYLADFDANQIYFISRTTRQLVSQVVVGPRPSDLNLSMDGNQLYAALSGGSEIAVVDLERRQTLPSLPLSFSPAYLVAGRPPYLYSTSVLEFWKGFTTYGQTYQLDSAARTQNPLPEVGLLEIDPTRRRLYLATHRQVLQYRIGLRNGQLELEGRADTDGPVLEMQLSPDGSRLYTISAGYFATPEMIVSHGLIDSRHNTEVDVVEVFGTEPLTKVGELYTGAYPRAVAHNGPYLVVAAADSAGASLGAGFAVRYDPVSLKPQQTYRLVGVPSGCAVVDPQTGLFYVAVDNPYDLRERFGDRQDLQVVPLGLLPEAPAPAPVQSQPVVRPQTPAASPVEADSAVTWGEHLEVRVPAGVFIMGSEEGDGDERPAHQVSLDEYYIDQFEVSVGQYRACVEAGACPEPAAASLCNWGGAVEDDHPINCIRWAEAEAYCAWAGMRLPTEAEWEKAARGTDARTYPWGEDFDRNRANYADHGIMQRTRPVGSYPEGRSPYGAYDLAGNVYEWVADWYEPNYYASSPPENPPGPTGGGQRVLRGGSWWFEYPKMRAFHREPYHPADTDIDIGFRCARGAAP